MRLRWAAPTALCAALLAFSGCGGSTALNPTPTISALYPDTLPAAGANCGSLPTFVINVQGNNFIATSVAYWNGSSRTSVFNQSTAQLAVTLKACDISAPGVGYVTVSNPPPGGGLTVNAASFQVTQPPNPTPQISSLSPASTPAGTLPTGGILTINGPPAAAGSISPAFVAASVAAFNGSTRATTFVSATELQVQMLMSDVMTAGTINVTVSTPVPGGGVASAQFTVTDPPNAANFPQVISVNATGGAANGASSSPAMSADGRYVAFYSEAKNLVASGASGNIFVRDTCLGATTCTPHTTAVDLAPDGSAPNAVGDWRVSISADGRYVAFSSSAKNLLDPTAEPPNSDDLKSNVFVRDICLGPTVAPGCSPHTTQVSLGLGSEPPNDASTGPSLSSDGRFVAFQSYATNLAVGLADRQGRVFVTDLCTGLAANDCQRETYLVSPEDVTTSDFVQQDVSISASGRYVVFTALPHGNRMQAQIDLRDTCLGKNAPQGCLPSTTTVSVDEKGSDGEASSFMPSVSADGRFVVFDTVASNLAPNVMDENGRSDRQVVVRDTCLGSATPKTCVPSTSAIPLDPAFSDRTYQSFVPSISPSGRFISFGATLSVPADPSQHLLVRDTCFGAQASGCVPYTAVASVSHRGELGNVTTLPQMAISADGRIIAFASDATNLAAPTSGLGDVFLMLMPSPKP